MFENRLAGPGTMRPWFRVLVSCFISLTLVAIAAPAAPASSGGLRRIGYLARHPGDFGVGASGNILVDSAARRAYQVIFGETTTLHEIDLDTLRDRRSVTLPSLQPAQTESGPVEWLWALDSAHRTMYVFKQASGSTGGESYELMPVDLVKLKPGPSVVLWPLRNRLPIAISYDAPANKLYVLTRAPVVAAGRSPIFAEERTTDGALVWEHQVTSCFGALDHQYPPTIARSVLRPSTMYLNCYNSGDVQGLVVRINLDSTGKPSGTDEVFPAVPGALSTMFDPGSDRMFFLTTNSGAGRGAWVFDGLRSSFLGVIATGDNRLGAFAYAMGLDATTGRIYMQTAVGFLVADARRTPLPAGLLFRSFAAPGIGSIQVDETTGRVFVPDSITAVDGQPQRYLVLGDDVPASADPALGDPDALTVDVAEKDGVTATNFSGGARAFALRTLTTGGLQKAAWNVALGTFSPEDSGIGSAYKALLTVPLDAGNRDLYAARVEQVSMSREVTEASASGASADDGTLRDLSKSSQPWPFPPAKCSDEGSKPNTAAATGGLAGASCDTKASAASATAGVQGISNGQIETGSMTATGSVQRDSKRGVVSRAAATATGTRIAGKIWIGSLVATAESWAHGRPGKAGARFARTIGDVRIDVDGDGTPEFSCTVCDPNAVRTAVATLLGGQIMVEFPQPDATYFAKGSPGGYQAIVEKNRFRGFAERALNDDDSPEVPAMQVTFYSDGRAGRTRQVTQIAGVQAESHYGIYLLPSDVIRLPDNGPPCCPQIRRTIAPPPARAIDIPDAAPQQVLERVLNRVGTGLGIRWLHPRDALLMATLWLFLLLPAYMLWRRRLIGART